MGRDDARFLGAMKQRYQIRHSLGQISEHGPFQGVEVSVGSTLERLKARFFAPGADRHLWEPYLSPPDC